MSAELPPQTLQIENLSKSGEGVARREGRAIFVPETLPGELVSARVSMQSKVLRGELVQVLQASPDRRQPPCSYVGRCGGCTWQHVAVEAQLKAKEDIVWSTLAHIGHVDRDHVLQKPTIASPQALGYRRRATFHPAQGGIGFHTVGTHQTVQIDVCLTLTPALNRFLQGVTPSVALFKKDWHSLSVVESDGSVSVSIQLKGAVKERHRLAALEINQLAEVRGVFLVSDNATASAETFGQPLLQEDGVYLHPDGFAQGNAAVNRLLVSAVVEGMHLSPVDTLVELYSGNGNFTVPCASLAQSVVAVESARLSVSLAQKALRDAKIDNVKLIEQDADKAMRGLIASGARFHGMLIDPPRAGARQAAQWAAALLVQRVGYVSCDPASLARDTALFNQQGYVLQSIQLFDLFPQTPHIETLAFFDRQR
jgi:23S rRNA (uracil1939-C5)-methyltransferase